MPRKRRLEDLPAATLAEALHEHRVPELKALVRALGKKPEGRKADLVEAVVDHVAGKGLEQTWRSLDELEQAAVAQAVHEGPRFDDARFLARHGSVPDVRADGALRLFLPGKGVMPDDLRERLRAFVPPPAAPRIRGQKADPEQVRIEARWGDGTTTRPLVQRAMEPTALHDLGAVLRLVDQGTVRITEKSRHPTAASVRAVAEVLLDGDFYAGEADERAFGELPTEVGPVRAFAWPMLVQAGKLVRRDGRRLKLSGAGRRALETTAPEDVVRGLWDAWLGTGLLDEFSRVSAIRGQSGKGARGMTAVAPRRYAVADALGEMPGAEWVAVDELCRFMRASDMDFEVTHDPWHLYVADRHYGSLGYAGYHDWGLLQRRYVLAVLFEYAATLGILDVAYTDPSDARPDFRELWGSDELYFLSRYDGLFHVRLTALGEYALGGSTYEPPVREPAEGFRVLANLEVVGTGEVAPADRLLLDRWCEGGSPRVWRLDRTRAFEAMAEGEAPDTLRRFLEAACDPLPDPVKGFFQQLEERGGAVMDEGRARLFECRTEELAALVAGDRTAGGLCVRAGERGLVVGEKDVQRFRAAVHALGYGVGRDVG